MKNAGKYEARLEPIVKSLPDKPGIYRFLDSKGRILYIGKAKNLRKRVSSYFNKEASMSGRLKLLIRKTEDIGHIVVDTELDALLLENNLIKEHQPRYNVQLKDDKSFPWICIRKERFPRIFSTRNPVRDGSEYFGPYASVRMMNTLLDLVKQLYPLRTCKYTLSEENIRKGKFSVCLEYHLGNCLGPCEGRQSEADYNQTIDSIREIIRGNITTVIRQLKLRMKEYADRLEFEKAQIVKEKLKMLERYQSKSTVVNPRINNVDVFSMIHDRDAAYVNFIKVVDGAIIQSHTIELRKKLDETPQELLTMAILDLRSRFVENAGEIIVPFKPGPELPDVKFTVPVRGDKKHLLDLSERNARFYKLEKEKQLELVDPERHSRRILERMMSDLRMKVLPSHIECFDNSNIHGDQAVAAMVCFKNAKPDKKEYRHYIIRTVKGPDDYASMEEIIYRRYKRLLNEEKPLPQLIVVDGGKGQLNAALKSLEKLGLKGKITTIGLAKRLEEIYFPHDPVPLYLDKKSETLRVIRHLRDEAHRFGITHHRKRREKQTIRTELTRIEGIGLHTAEKLLKDFKSVKTIKSANMDELQASVGNARGRIVWDYFHGESN